MERPLRRCELSLTLQSGLIRHKFSNELHLLVVVSHFNVNYIVKIYSLFTLLNYIMKIQITLTKFHLGPHPYLESLCLQGHLTNRLELDLCFQSCK